MILNMVKLVFMPSDELTAIFEHTKNAKEWSNPYGLMPEVVDKMHIDFVKDQGIYIMSGNKETLEGKDTHNMVVYARGYDPKTNDDCWEESRYAVGGDDFCTPMEVDEEMCDRVIGGDAFVIEVSGENWSYWTAPTKAKVKS